MAEDTMPFVWGSGGAKDSPRRRLAEALLKSGTSSAPVGHWVQGLARIGDAISGQWELNKEEAARQKSNDALAKAFEGFGGAGQAPVPVGAAPSMAGGGSARTMAMPNVSPEVKDGIVQTAASLGISPVDLATTISYETGGTFDPTKAGPTTKWGQHRGLIQFGEPQAKQYGVDWSNPVGSQLGANGAVAAYLRDRGVKPGMGLMDIYSTINAGAPGLYDRSDVAAGGAPGTVADKVNNQMSGHRAKAMALFGNAGSSDVAMTLPDRGGLTGPASSYLQNLPATPSNVSAASLMQPAADLPAVGASAASMDTQQPGFAIPPAAGAPQMTGATFDQITNGMGSQPLDPVFQTEGASQPWMGTALQPAQPDTTTQIAQALSQTMPPPRPADLAMPQADLPAPGAAQAMGQLPVATSPQPIIADPTKDNAGVLSGLVASEEQRQGQQNGAGITSPFSGIAQALSASPSASPAPSGDSVFTKLAGALGGSPAGAAPASAQAAPSAPAQASTAAAASNPMMGLAAALIRSGNVKEGVAIAQDVMKPANGVQMGDRLVDPRTGRVIADFSQANGGRSNEFGLQPIYGVGPDGKPVIMQLGKRGDATATKMPDGVSLARDPIKVDGPTGTTLLDPQTRQPVGFIPKEIAQAKVEEAKGTAQGAAVVGLPTAIAQANQMLKSIDQVRNHPGRNDWGATGASADWPIIGGGLGGTKARDFVGSVDQLKGKSFLEAFNSLKGAGAISEVEGAKATAAIARLDRAQSKDGFDSALNDLEEVVRGGMATAQKKAGVTPSGNAPVAAPSQGGWQDIGGVKIRKKQ